MHDDRATRLLHRGHQGLAVQGRDRQQVDDLALRAVFLGQRVGRLARQAEHGAVGDQREVRALAHHLRSAERHRLDLVGDVFLGGVIEALVLEEDHRIGIADGADQQGAGVARSRGDDHLQPGDVRVELLLDSEWCSSARTPPPYGMRMTIGTWKRPCERMR